MDKPMKASALPNAQAFYRFKTQDAVIEKIQSALEYGEALMTVTGPDGVGKSQIARIIKRIFSDENFYIVSLNSDISTEQQLFERIAKVVGAVKEDNFVSGLQKLLSADNNNQKQLLIIADDSDRLAPAILNALRILSNLQADSNRLIQLVLFGNCQLNQVLGQPDYFGFLQRVTHTFYLQPLTDIHIQESMVTNSLDFSLASAAAKYLASSTHGLPSIIVLYFDAFIKLNQKNVVYSKQDIKNIAATDSRIIEAQKALASKYSKPLTIIAGSLVIASAVWFVLTPKIDTATQDPFESTQIEAPKLNLVDSSNQAKKNTKNKLSKDPENERVEGNSSALSSGSSTNSNQLSPEASDSDPSLSIDKNVARNDNKQDTQSNAVLMEKNAQATLEKNAQFDDVNAQDIESTNEEYEKQLASKEQIEQEISQLEQERKQLVLAKERERKAYKTSEAVARIAQSYQQQLSDPKSAIESSELAIKIATDRWANAWSTQSISDYIDSYVDDYTMHDGWPRETWVRIRKQRIEAPDWIKIRVSDFKIISVGSEYYQANFWLHYQSPGYSDHTLKLLTFKMEDSGWKISSEKNLRVIRD
jgi:type II secretory pathway predicted ATPase ExeA